jgi:hypothetical protein
MTRINHLEERINDHERYDDPDRPDDVPRLRSTGPRRIGGEIEHGH